MEAFKINPESITVAPLISQWAYAGYIGNYLKAEYYEAQPKYVSNTNYGKGNFIAFEVRGDSMDEDSNRSICHGDVVLAKELHKDYWNSKLHVPCVFVIIHKTEGIFLKEITHHNIDANTIICHSYNPKYDDFELSLDDVIQLFYIKEYKRNANNEY